MLLSCRGRSVTGFYERQHYDIVSGHFARPVDEQVLRNTTQEASWVQYPIALVRASCPRKYVLHKIQRFIMPDAALEETE